MQKKKTTWKVKLERANIWVEVLLNCRPTKQHAFCRQTQQSKEQQQQYVKQDMLSNAKFLMGKTRL